MQYGSYFKLVLTERRPLLLILVLITLGALYFYLTLPVVTSTEAIVPKDEKRLFYEEFRQVFGADDALGIAFHSEKLFTPETLRFIEALTKALEEIPEVEDVLSLTNVEDIRGAEGTFVVEPLIGEEIPQEVSRLEWIKERALKNPLIRGNLVSADARATMIVIRPAFHGEDEDLEARLLKAVEKTIEELKARFPEAPELHLAGWPVIDVKMASYMNHDLAIFIPLTYILMAVLLYLFLRRLRAVSGILLVMTLSLIWTMAVLNLVGGAMSPMTAILSPLIMALSLADGVHLTSRFYLSQTTRSPRDTQTHIVEAVRESWKPCLLTSLTTAAGFLSLVTSRIPAIRHFGLSAAAGMMIEFILTFSVLVMLLPWIGRETGKQRSFIHNDSLLQKAASLSELILKGRLIIILLTTGVVVFSLWGASQIKVETNLLEFFKEKSPIREAARFVDAHLGGSETIEISLRAEEPEAFLEPKNLVLLERISSFLARRQAFSKVIGAHDFLKQMNQAFHDDHPQYYRLPETRELIAQYLLLYSGTELNHFLDEDHSWARISARTILHNSSELEKEIEAIKQFVKEKIAPQAQGITIEITGKTYLNTRVIKDIVSSQTQSLTIAGAIVFGFIFLALRSLSLGIIALAPNFLPLITNFGLMGWTGIPLNTSTATISAVAIGIVVDDTIHFLNQYQLLRRTGLSVTKSLTGTFATKGVAVTITSVVLVVAFGILVLSKFVPTVQFGFLSATIMLVAFLADIFLLPAILSYQKERGA
ncbi:efflux RND transporter permease subunit [Thermosulfuriphilus sp.]